MKIPCRVFRVVFQQSLKLHYGSFQIATVHIFHRKTVAPEGIARILLHHRLQNLYSTVGHRYCYYSVEQPQTMSCPLFIPTSPLGELVSGAAPLGELYDGRCAADPAALIEPETLRRYCNFGYARGHCGRAAKSGADAVRLLVKAERGSIVEIAWAVERNHHPVAVGNMEIEVGQPPAPTDETLSSQAYACATAYVRQVHATTARVGRIAAAAHP